MLISIYSLSQMGKYSVRPHLKAVIVFFAMSCATTIYTHLDTVMLGFMTTDIDVGYYNAAIKIKYILVSIVTSLGVVLLPRASYYVQRGQMNEFYRITKKAINFVMLVATPMMVYFILFAKEGILFLYLMMIMKEPYFQCRLYASIVVNWINKYYGNTDIGSIRKRTNSFIFRNSWSCD